MNYSLFIADRYLRSKRRTGFISLITFITAGGVMIGVAALVIVLSVMNGLETEVRDRIIGNEAHVQVTMFHEEPMIGWQGVMDSLRGVSQVTGAAPFIRGKGMLRYGKSIEGTLVKGLEQSLAGEVGELPNIVVAGKLRLDPVGEGVSEANANPPLPPPSIEGGVKETPTEVGAPQEDGSPHPSNLSTGLSSLTGAETRPPVNLPGMLLGRQLAFRMGVAIGDTVIALSPAGMTGLMSVPRLKRFQVTGIVESGIFEYDDLYSYVSLASAQDLFELGNAVTGIELKLTNRDRAPSVASAIEDKLGYPYFPQTWHDSHRTLFRWMKLEKWLYTILLSLIILVAAFNIVSSQIMVVLEKQREIGILKAIGATREGIMRIFMYEGLIVGAVGTIAGLAVGAGLCWAQLRYKFFSLPGDVYFLSYLPVRMQLLDFVVVALVALGLTLLATVYPARRAADLDPVEAIRYE